MKTRNSVLALLCSILLVGGAAAEDKGDKTKQTTPPAPTKPATPPVVIVPPPPPKPLPPPPKVVIVAPKPAPPPPPLPPLPQKNCPANVYLQGPGTYAAGPVAFSGNGGFVAFNLTGVSNNFCGYNRSQAAGYYAFVAANFLPGNKCAAAPDGKGFFCSGVPAEIKCPPTISVGPVGYVSLVAGGPLVGLPPAMKAIEDQITVKFKTVEIWPSYGPSGAPAMRCNYGDWPTDKPRLQ